MALLFAPKLSSLPVINLYFSRPLFLICLYFNLKVLLLPSVWFDSVCKIQFDGVCSYVFSYAIHV